MLGIKYHQRIYQSVPFLYLETVLLWFTLLPFACWLLLLGFQHGQLVNESASLLNLEVSNVLLLPFFVPLLLLDR